MSIKCKECTESLNQAISTHKGIKLARWFQRRNRALTSMGWRYHV